MNDVFRVSESSDANSAAFSRRAVPIFTRRSTRTTRLFRRPRWTPQKRPFRAWRLRLVEFSLVASVVRKSDWIVVRQLRGPHLRTWP